MESEIMKGVRVERRGRPKKDPSELKSIVYVKTGGKRGRPKKNA